MKLLINKSPLKQVFNNLINLPTEKNVLDNPLLIEILRKIK